MRPEVSDHLQDTGKIDTTMRVLKYLLPCIAAVQAVCSCSCGDDAIMPVPFSEVTLEGGFWKSRMQTELDVTVPFSVGQSAPAVERFRQCAEYREGKSDVKPFPNRSISSHLYKVMESVAYSLMLRPDKDLEAFMDSTASLISRSQQDDGYLYISHICGNPVPSEMGEKPYSYIVHSHELYNVGHLYETAVAYWQATGKRNLLDIAEKSARHVNRVIFEGDPAYNGGKPIMQAPGHEEIELALCKLYRATGNRLYLDMAKRFLDIRGVTYRPDGEGILAPEYAQQHLPVAQQTRPAGHAVRAMYLYTAMAQVDALTGRNDYEAALDSIWTNLVSTRMHITGGLGAVRWIEGFGDEYDLPNRDAYDETCAAVANVFFNHGMFLRSGDARYLDVAEVSLFNNALAGISLSGDRFFYVNPLEADGKFKFNQGAGGRVPWFGCSCCPPNISRLILQVPGYMYAYGKDRIFVTLYGSSTASVQLKGRNVSLSQVSDYPFDGKVRICVSPERPSVFSLCLRIPTWCSSGEFCPGGLYRYADGAKHAGAVILVNGEPAEYDMDKGFAVVRRKWSEGDILELDLNMPVHRVVCSPKVKDNAGLSAFTRGPLVYCAEEADNGPVGSLSCAGDPGAPDVSAISSGPLEGIPSFAVPGARSEGKGHVSGTDIVLVPYYSWCNRGDDQTMKVWIPDRN